jgi:hypothetical protein
MKFLRKVANEAHDESTGHKGHDVGRAKNCSCCVHHKTTRLPDKVSHPVGSLGPFGKRTRPHGAGSRGRVKWVLMLNPCHVLKQLRVGGLVDDRHYVAVLDRTAAIGSRDELKGGSHDAQ